MSRYLFQITLQDYENIGNVLSQIRKCSFSNTQNRRQKGFSAGVYVFVDSAGKCPENIYKSDIIGFRVC